MSYINKRQDRKYIQFNHWSELVKCSRIAAKILDIGLACVSLKMLKMNARDKLHRKFQLSRDIKDLQACKDARTSVVFSL